MSTEAPERDPGAIRRRDVLALAAVTVVSSACARATTRPAGSRASTTLGDSHSPYQLVQGLGQAFAAAHPGITLAPAWSGPVGAPRPVPLPPSTRLVLVAAGLGQVPFLAPAGAHPLAIDAALRSVNFDWLALPDGAAASTAHGQRMAIPWSQEPLAVAWRQDVFTAAGLAPPESAWTWDDFEATCRELEAFAETGAIAGLKGGVPPGLVFVDGPGVPGRPESSIFDGLPQLWMAFVLGYGGSVVSGAAFHFDASALAGLQAYVDLIRRVAPPTGANALPGEYAMAWTTWWPPSVRRETTGPLALDSRWAYARLPRFGVKPVVTTTLRGVGLASVPGTVPAASDLLAAGEALAWLYTPEAQRLIGDAGNAPAVNSGDVQAAFWRLQSAEDQAVGDWANFVSWSAGWPWIRPTLLNLGLSSAIEDPRQLETVVAKYEQRINGWMVDQR